ncbi:hypothetical protein Tco_0521732 [Tanacetum coccineum]
MLVGVVRSVETEFPAIVYNDALTSIPEISAEPTVSPLNSIQIDFRISFNESDDEDHTVWKSVRYGVSKDWIRRIGDFLE